MRRTLETVTRRPRSGPPWVYGLPGTAMMATETGQPLGQTLKLYESKNASGRRYALSSEFARMTSSDAAQSCSKE